MKPEFEEYAQNLYDKRPLLGVPSLGAAAIAAQGEERVKTDNAQGERREVRDIYQPTWDEELRNK